MRHGCHAFSHQVGDAHEGQSAIDEALHGDLVGRVEGAAGSATTFDRLEREARGRESVMIDGLELERAQTRSAMPMKGSRPSMKPCTAISLAALRVQPAVPPRSIASSARPGAGNRS